MHSIPLSQVASSNERLPLFIESIEGGSYIALTEVDNQRLPVTDDKGAPIKGANLSQIQAALDNGKWSSVVLVQRAAQDEMIGSQPEDRPVYEIPLRWSSENHH